MTICTSAFGKASASGSLRLSNIAARSYSTTSTATSKVGNSSHSKPSDAATQRELFVNVLKANATKRDAKQYLARFKNSEPTETAKGPLGPDERTRTEQDRLHRSGVNLGGLYGPARAIAESPQFVREDLSDSIAIKQTLHVALVLLRAPEMLEDATLDGVALTLTQLVKLDMRILVVLDCGLSNDTVNPGRVETKGSTELLSEQGNRLNQAIDRHSDKGARVVNGAMETLPKAKDTNQYTTQNIFVGLPKLLIDPLKRSLIPIVPSLAYNSSGQRILAPTSQIMQALSLLFSGLPTTEAPNSEVDSVRISLDRIIVLDSNGGIPSKSRSGDSHVFINLEQEFSDIRGELVEYSHAAEGTEQAASFKNVYRQHAENLQMLQDCLKMLPPATSALIITPEEAASSSRSTARTEDAIGAGTRRQKNTLIHNLLTNKPMVSSSLPVARLPQTFSPDVDGSAAAPTALKSTLVKRGMPLTIIPSPVRGEGWMMPLSGTTSLDLKSDPRVDLPRLVHLIEDSFRRKLNVEHYLSRIHNRIAGLIVAGSYEGGAILTWEQPPGTSDLARLVPYLDKFAVLSSSQGSAGVADILFQSMVRTCFPDGVCWRSRKDNPVNKWYFERADGHWQIPGTNWTMFWTGNGIAEKKERWEDYVGVCRSVGPSWVDPKRPD